MWLACFLASLDTQVRTCANDGGLYLGSTFLIADWMLATNIRFPVLDSCVVPDSMNIRWSCGLSSGWLMTYCPASVATCAKQPLNLAQALLAAFYVFQPVYHSSGSIRDMNVLMWWCLYGCAFLIKSLTVFTIYAIKNLTRCCGITLKSLWPVWIMTTFGMYLLELNRSNTAATTWLNCIMSDVLVSTNWNVPKYGKWYSLAHKVWYAHCRM